VRRVEVVLGGQGGQGIRFAGIVLGQACAGSGRQVASSATYGPEVRGTFVRSEVIISDERITYPMALNPQYALVLTQEAYDRLWPELATSGCVLFDPRAVTPATGAPQRHFPVPIVDRAVELGEHGAANLVLLGAFCALTGLADQETLKQALPDTNREANEAALAWGFCVGDGQSDAGRKPAAKAAS
jgi:2-oxoglutarate ferredoxin oxidoreductase subunit gamma